MYRVDETACTGCGDCVEACPAGAIGLVGGRAYIDDATCAECGSCADACSQGAIVLTDAVGPAYPIIRPQAGLTPVTPVMTSAETAGLAQRPDTRVLPAGWQRSRIWPMVGGALVWAARELLPEVLAARQASRASVVQPTGRESKIAGRIASQQSGARHHHRWGRV